MVVFAVIIWREDYRGGRNAVTHTCRSNTLACGWLASCGWLVLALASPPPFDFRTFPWLARPPRPCCWQPISTNPCNPFYASNLCGPPSPEGANLAFSRAYCWKPPSVISGHTFSPRAYANARAALAESKEPNIVHCSACAQPTCSVSAESTASRCQTRWQSPGPNQSPLPNQSLRFPTLIDIAQQMIGHGRRLLEAIQEASEYRTSGVCVRWLYSTGQPQPWTHSRPTQHRAQRRLQRLPDSSRHVVWPWSLTVLVSMS